ncbi:winged helix-turn-helix transcriptional regulator [bacterium]|nr:MAG: winged helix-turn-helix transcriptional regulator [bacterium]
MKVEVKRAPPSLPSAREKVKKPLVFLPDTVVYFARVRPSSCREPVIVEPSERSFFQGTRGKIIESLGRTGGATAREIATELGLTPNAVRQQFSTLAGEGLVATRSARRGPTKPTLLYHLTQKAERLFPQRTDQLLHLVLNQIADEEGGDRIDDIFRRIGKRSAEKFRPRLEGKDYAGKIHELAAILREQGVIADVEQLDDGKLVLREHNCPFAASVRRHPEVCTLIHTVMDELLPGTQNHTTSFAKGDNVCTFELTEDASTAAEAIEMGRS